MIRPTDAPAYHFDARLAHARRSIIDPHELPSP